MSFPVETCPYCGMEGCEADWVDIEVGYQQCGPFVCHRCGASSIGSYDTNERDADEKRTGWFKPAKVGTSTNTFMGVHMDHKAAKSLYDRGLLDKPFGTCWNCGSKASRKCETCAHVLCIDCAGKHPQCNECFTSKVPRI